MSKTDEMNILVLFEQHPGHQYSMKEISSYISSTPDNTHAALVALEEANQIIRSKVNIRDKPVTYWQIKTKRIYDGRMENPYGPNYVPPYAQPIQPLNDFRSNLKPFNPMKSGNFRTNYAPNNQFHDQQFYQGNARYYDDFALNNSHFQNLKIVAPNDISRNQFSRSFHENINVSNSMRPNSFRSKNFDKTKYQKEKIKKPNPDLCKPRPKFEPSNEMMTKPCPNKGSNNNNVSNETDSFKGIKKNIQDSSGSNVVVPLSKSVDSQQHPHQQSQQAVLGTKTTSVISMDIVNSTQNKTPTMPVKPITNTSNIDQQAKVLNQNNQNKNKKTNKNKSSLSNNTSTNTPSSSSSYDLMNAITKNPITVLHEYAQKNSMTCEIQVLEMTGPSHKPKITVGVKLDGVQYEPVVASNKKDAKRNAAELVIRKLISNGRIKSDQNATQITMPNWMTETDHHCNVITNFPDNKFVTNLNALVQNRLAIIMSDLSSKTNLSLAGRKVASAFILENRQNGACEVICLATGNRCITGDKISLQGTVIHDSHAEVIARRSLKYFLYHQLQSHLCQFPSNLGLFDEVCVKDNFSDSRKFQLKPHFKFHLYISTAPCGDSALFSTSDNACTTAEPVIITGDKHHPIYENSNQGMLRCKIESGEGTITLPPSREMCQYQTLDGILRGERLKTMSCSDKIARWNYLGLQGSLLSQYLIEPIFIDSIVLGNLFQPNHLSRGVCCRLTKRDVNLNDYVNHPHLMYTGLSEMSQREVEKTNELSINWSRGCPIEIIDGVTGLPSRKVEQQHQLMYSRLSKVSLFHEYFKVQKLLKAAVDNMHLSYREIKDLSSNYNAKRKNMYSKFHIAKLGSWMCKPSELSVFKNSFNV